MIGLFAIVLWVGSRIALRSTDPFLRMLSAVATMWIILQACINIGYVVGLLPVTGLQLPLISAGGTSMLTTMVMFGLIAHAAYREPEAIVSLSSDTSRPAITRVFGKPQISAPTRRVDRPRTPRARAEKPASGKRSATPRTGRAGAARVRTTDTPARRAGRERHPQERQPREARSGSAQRGSAGTARRR